MKKTLKNEDIDLSDINTNYSRQYINRMKNSTTHETKFKKGMNKIYLKHS